MLPSRFAVVFEGQSTPEAHYVGVFGTYPANNRDGTSSVCLALSPLDDETSHDAEERMTFL